MSITSFIKKVCVQTAVYWGSPVPDGYGGYTFATAKEIMVRWDDKSELIKNRLGNEIMSNAELLVQEDLDEEGYLYLGTLALLSTAEKANPLLVPKAYQIQRIEKSPLIKSTTVFVRKVYL